MQWGGTRGTAEGIELVRTLRRMPDRTTFLGEWSRERSGELGSSTCVVKRWSRRPLLDRLRGGSPARREERALTRLAEAGFPVPRVLAREEGESGSTLVMEYVAHAEDLEQRLARSDPAARRRELARLAELVARFHDAGFYHRDLYLTHVVLRSTEEGDELVLLDLGRARRRPRPRERWFVKDLAALLHSRPTCVTRAEVWRFLARYLERRGLAPVRRRAWARRVLVKAARIARHAPRHADPDTWRPPGTPSGAPSGDLA